MENQGRRALCPVPQSRLFPVFHSRAGVCVMPNLDARARLVFWPERSWDQGSDYETLRQALTEGAQRPTETPWNLTLSGRILKPREISELISTLQGAGT